MNNRIKIGLLSGVSSILFFVNNGSAQGKPKPPVPPIEVKEGKLVYNKDSAGYSVPDFSICGYMQGDVAIPNVPVRVTVPAKKGDATWRIQSAINYVSSLPLDRNGIRGAVLLEKGLHEVQGSLSINASGVVLRGSGMGNNGTVLLGAGTDRETLIRIYKTEKSGQTLTNAGLESLLLRSTFNAKNIKDEAHRWMAITMEDVSDSWVRQIVFEHFAGSAVSLLETTSRITIEDCKSLQPVSEIGGYRRNTFYTAGHQNLFQRIYAEYGYHDFAVGNTEGPNAFVQCESYLPYSYSGPISGGAQQVLFDIVKVDGNMLGFPGGDRKGQGTANSVLWQCTASRVENYRSNGAPNWAFGIWAETAGNGIWFYSDEHVQPRSLYYAQLSDRIGKERAMQRAWLLDIGSEASSSPTIEKAAELTLQAKTPLLELSAWIEQVVTKQPISTTADGIKSIDQIGVQNQTPKPASDFMKLSNGWLVRSNGVMKGNRHQVSWWRGGFSPKNINESTPHITRYVPGRVGTGYTDNLEEVGDWMVSRNLVALDHNYGLWYDRRRDDHERIRRMNGEVRAPFYELPFARTGEGTAWDGLSKYDVSQYNSWYWKRLQTFATVADQKGLVLLHQNYFQHNILEAGAHYADFPWRPANNVNNTPFVEPVHYAGDKRIFYAEQFYDVSNPAYRKLHRAYIRQCLNNFKDNSSVIQLISAEYTGPLHFVEFWLDVIAEWEKETGKKQLIGLSTTKDVQDAILTDKKRAGIVDLIDIRYWFYQSTGDTYAPAGGKNLAPRQHMRQMKYKEPTFEQVYRAVKEYRIANPGKAVIYSSNGYDKFGWAVFMAGGSLPALPSIENSEFLIQAALMQPVGSISDLSGDLQLASEGKGYIIYTSKRSIQLDLTRFTSRFSIQWIDPQSGKNMGQVQTVQGGKKVILENPGKTSIMWAEAVK